MYKINDEVFHAQYERQQRFTVCPDCAGKKFLTVIMGDGTQYTINCVNCTRGAYEGPHGTIETWDFEATVTKRKITGIEMEPNKTVYRSYIFHSEGGSSYYTLENEDIFDTEIEAVARAKELKAKAEAVEAEHLTQKRDHNRTWAWHASYHRKEIKTATEQLVYHTAQLERAKAHVKEEKVK